MTELDARLFLAVHDALSGGTPVLLVMAALTVLGSGWSMLALLPLFAYRRTRRFGAALVGTLAVTSLVVFVVKNVARRVRPCARLDGVRALVFAAPDDYSFPSGHAAGSFAFAAFVAVVLLRSPSRSQRHLVAVAAIFALATGVGLSRIALGVHFPGDVAAGALLGVALGVLGARLTLRSPGG